MTSILMSILVQINLQLIYVLTQKISYNTKYSCKYQRDSDMEFLNRVLGIRITYQTDTPVFMPRQIDVRYKIHRVTFDGKLMLFVYPKGDLGPVSTLKDHLKRIEKNQEAPAVLILDRLTHRQRDYLLRDRIPFVVDGKQIFLPFMGTYLMERCDVEKKETGEMLPSAQLLLLLYIYHGCGEMETGQAAKMLSFSATSVSRASRQLEEMGLIRTEKRGVQKVISSGKTPEELFLTAKSSMIQPVKRTIYVPKIQIEKTPVLGGISALSQYVRMDPPMVTCLASDSISAWEKSSTGSLIDPGDQYEVELWRYDPKKLADHGRVDRLSLALALGNDRDKRVREAVREMLKQVWTEIDSRRGSM